MKNPKNRGFTLIELLVTIVIIALLGIVIVQSFVTTIRTNAKTEIQKDIKQNGDLVVDNITRKVRDAESIDCNTANVIKVTNVDASNNHIDTVYQAVLDGNSCRVQTTVGTDPAEFLTSPDLTLTNTAGAAACTASFSVTCTDIGATPARAVIGFTLMPTDPTHTLKAYETAVQKFETSVTLRNIN